MKSNFLIFSIIYHYIAVLGNKLISDKFQSLNIFSRVNELSIILIIKHQ